MPVVVDNIFTIEEIQAQGALLAEYEPLNKDQTDFWKSTANIKWLFGGNRSGKTYNNMIDLSLLALDIHPFRYIPNGVHWACIESWEQVRDILWYDYLEKIIPRHQIANIQYGQDKVPRKLFLKSGHVIEFKAFNQGSELFQGRAIDSCHCDEQCHHHFRNVLSEIQARLSDKAGYLSWSMTPIKPQGALEERIANLPKTDEVFYFNLDDNRISEGGYIPDDRIDALIDDWPEEVQATRIEGKFASFFGAVYKTFNRQTHVIEPFDIPKSWTKVNGIDFGFTNPFVCLWVAIDGDGVCYVYHEYYKSQTGMEDHASYIKKHSQGIKYITTYSDHDSQDRFELDKYEVPTINARKEVHPGIETIQKLLKIRPNGKPRLYVFDTCTNLIRQFGSYHYPEGTNNKDPQDVPVSKEDHTVDALRYAIHTHLEPEQIVRAAILGKLY